MTKRELFASLGHDCCSDEHNDWERPSESAVSLLKSEEQQPETYFLSHVPADEMQTFQDPDATIRVTKLGHGVFAPYVCAKLHTFTSETVTSRDRNVVTS